MIELPFDSSSPFCAAVEVDINAVIEGSVMVRL